MRKLLYTCALFAAVAAGCNKTTTTGTSISPRTGETVKTKLSVMAATDHTVSRGSTEKVSVMINRDNFNDPVTITLSGLPKGVTQNEKELVIPGDSTSVTANLTVDKEAAVGEHTVTITASAKGVEDNKQSFKLTVK